MSRVHNRRLAIGTVIGMLLAAIVAASPSAASPNKVTADIPDVPPVVVGGDLTSAQLEDLGTLAEDRGISLQESIDRYGWQESFAMLAAEIETMYPDSYAGARIESSGNPWIAFKGDIPPGASAAVEAFDAEVFSSNAEGPFSGSQYRVDLIPGRGYSEAELDDTLVDAHFAAIAETDLVANASSGYDITSGVVTVVVEPTDLNGSQNASQVVAELRVRLAAFERVTIHAGDVKTGDHANIYGGDAMSTCTSGFTVKKSSTRGIATAAHCSNTQSMGGSALTFQGEHDGTWGDVQWHTGTGYEYDDFYSGSSSDYDVNKRDVSSVGNAVEGQDLCRNGKTTFKECDKVYQLNHCSWNTCHLTAMHNKEGDSGDSGGPWFWGNTAYGLHQGWKFWNFKNRDLFTPQAYIDNGLAGVNITTS